MAPSNPELWVRLKAYEFPLREVREGRSVDRKLAEVLDELSHLTPPQVEVLVDEYRRFVYLVRIAGKILAPSPLVDFAWHTHLDHPQSYQLFCRSVLGMTLRHNEGRPRARKDPAYAETLRLYAVEFDRPADRRVWPPAARTVRAWTGLGLGFALAALVAAWVAPYKVAAAGMVGLVFIITLTLMEYPQQWTRHKLASARTDDGGCGGDFSGDDGGCGGDGGD